MMFVNMRKTAAIATLFAACLSPVSSAQEQAAAPVIKASPQSVDCFFPKDATAAVLCSVRLHLTPSPGCLIRVRAENMRPERPLIATDAAGNTLEGRFREWELCYDSDANCVIAVYDFNRHPEGGVLRVDTTVDIPASSEQTEHEPIVFAAAQKHTITSGGHTFHLSPTESSADDPDNTVLLIEYENSPDIADIVIQQEDGTPLQPEIVDGYLNADSKLVSAICILNSRSEKFRFVLRTYKQCNKVEVPVKFNATIGR